MKLTVLNPFTLDPDAHSDAHGLFCDDESLTVQADAAQADINNIVKQFGLSLELPYGLAVPEYADYTSIPNDYHAAMNFIKDADSVFMEMPANIRADFNHDAGQFLDFVDNPDNYDKAISLGLVPPKPAGSAEPNVSSGSAEPAGKQPEGVSAQSST